MREWRTTSLWSPSLMSMRIKPWRSFSPCLSSPPRFVPSCLCCVSLSFPRFMPETCTHYCGLACGCLQRRDGSFAFPKKNLQQLWLFELKSGVLRSQRRHAFLRSGFAVAHHQFVTIETSSSAKCPSCKQTRKSDSFFFEYFATFIVIVGVSSSCCQVEEQCWFFQKTAHPCVVEFTPTDVLLLLILKVVCLNAEWTNWRTTYL